MILAFKLSDLITVPFGYLLSLLYQLTNNYGWSMVIFAIVVQTVLLPMSAKSKKSMMKMSRLTPRVQDIQARYSNDQQKQNELIQQLYRDENVSMGGGCLWSLVPMLILFPLFTVIRQPITYILMESAENSAKIVEVIRAAAPEIFSANTYYHEVTAAQAIPQFADALRAAIPGISERTLAGINFSFLGINLGAIPDFRFWAWSSYNWANIGAFLIPLLSASSQVFQMWLTQKMNDSVITNEKGIQDTEAAKNSQQAQSSKMMMYMMPLMSLWIGFTVSAGLSVYWFIGGIYRTFTDAIMTKRYRTIYDAEDAIRLQKALEEDRIAAEKERVRAERRSANPDGITTNTSKKKLQKQQQAQEAAAKEAAAKEYAARKGIVEEEKNTESCMSGIPSRPYCKGRNYDPNRYASNSTEE